VTALARALGALFLTASLALPGRAPAAQAYRWVDEAGVVHFSDVLPPTDPGTLETVPLAPPAAPRDPAGDYYSIVNQLKRMQESRLALERERAEQRRRERELALKEQSLPGPRPGAIYYSPPPRIVYWGPWPSYHACRPWRPGCGRPITWPRARPWKPGRGDYLGRPRDPSRRGTRGIPGTGADRRLR